MVNRAFVTGRLDAEGFDKAVTGDEASGARPCRGCDGVAQDVGGHAAGQ